MTVAYAVELFARHESFVILLLHVTGRIARGVAMAMFMVIALDRVYAVYYNVGVFFHC